jgi:hypothetical protein
MVLFCSSPPLMVPCRPSRKHWSVRPMEYRVDWCQSVVSRYAILSFTDNHPQTSFGGLRNVLSINTAFCSSAPRVQTSKRSNHNTTHTGPVFQTPSVPIGHKIRTRRLVAKTPFNPRRRRDWLFDAPNLQ